MGCKEAGSRYDKCARDQDKRYVGIEESLVDKVISSLPCRELKRGIFWTRDG